jgi:hypothetical protein
MNTRTYNMTTAHQIPAGKKLFMAVMACATTMSAIANPALDADTNYASVSAGIALRSSELNHQLRLATGANPIILAGRTETDGQPHVNLTIGRQWHAEPTTEDPEPRRWRLEAQWWMTQLQRNRFQTGQLNVGLNDKIDISGIYANGLTRLWRGEKSQWWVGAGIGYARVSLPDASAASPGCGCLNAASGNGASWRITTSIERALSESTSIYGAATATRLPTVRSSSSALPIVETRIPTLGEIGIGLRFIF